VPDDVARITADDLTRLNRAELRRVAVVARWVATGLFAVAALGILAWGWSTIHAQVRAGDFGPGADGASFVDRVDLFTSDVVELVLVGVLKAGGVLVRMAGDALLERSGGTLCDYEVGDAVDPLDDDGDGGDGDDDFRPLTPLPPR
jgi:hypothetical protein